MKIVASWLNEHLSEPLSVAEMTTALEAAGIEVEEVITPPEFDSKIVTATVKEVKPHPNADRLQLAIVELGKKTYQVVCGAPNLAIGQRVAFAQVGAYLPNGMEMAQTKIRGQESFGMLCSERELGLGHDHDGILELGDETPAGVPLKEVFDATQAVIEVKTAANRWDLQSYQGLAREVAAHSHASVIEEKIVQGTAKATRVDDLFTNRVPDEVASYGLLKLKLKEGVLPSPRWMQRYLRQQGMRPINAVVDITNYVMCETGQPLHAFDAGKISKQIDVRFAESEEQITTLDGVQRSLSNDDLVIADETGPVALAGVMGSEDSEVTEATTEILLEAATFKDVLVRKTAKRHGLRTEASARFERGVPLQAMRQALRYATHLFEEHAGAEVISYQNEVNEWPWVQHIGVRTVQLNRLLGTKLESSQVVEYLKRQQFEVEEFDISEQARRHIGKPYKLGARFKTDGTDAFDCSYLTDYLYSLIGVKVGHTAHAQYVSGTPVEPEDLRPGDLIFRGGPWVELDEKEREGVSHVVLYIGNGRIVDARNNIRNQSGEWEELPADEQKVVELPLEEISEDPQFLGARRFVDDLEDYIRVTVPWWRPDVREAVDVAEEVIKLHGLEQLESSLPKWHPENIQLNTYWNRLQELRHALRGTGLIEVTTYPFISGNDIRQLQLEEKAHLKLQNPRSQEQAYLRTSLLPQMFKAAVNNITIKDKIGFFELAKTFTPRPKELLPQERFALGILRLEPEALRRVKNDLDQLSRLLHVTPRYVKMNDNPMLHPARQTAIEVNGVVIGQYGELHPKVMQSEKITEPMTFAELDIDRVLEVWQAAEYVPRSRYQSSFRDLSITVKPEVTWQQLFEALKPIENIAASFRDVYQRQKEKVITVRFELLAQEQTLDEEAIEQRITEIATTLERQLKAKIDR